MIRPVRAARVAFGCVVFWCVLGGFSAAAEDAKSMAPCLTGTRPDQMGQYAYETPVRATYFTWENDAIAIGSGSDESYTQGMQIGHRFSPDHTPSWLAGPASKLCNELKAHSDSNHQRIVGAASLFIGQHLFTPHSISESELFPDDRPYAAWLYAGARFEAFNIDDASNDSGAGALHTLEAQIGITGPRAQGEFIQTNFHRLIHDELPMGWDNQIPTEVGVFVRYNATKRLFLRDLGSLHPVSFDAVGSAEVALGNVQTYAQGGAVIRLGRNMGLMSASTLGPTFSTYAPVAAVALGADSSAQPSCFWRMRECYLFVGVTGRAVGYNAFVEGTLFHDSHGVSKEPFVYDLTWGFRLRSENVQVDYTFVRRSREFSPVAMGAEERSGRHDYGSLMIRCMKSWEGVCPTFVLTALAATFIQRKADQD